MLVDTHAHLNFADYQENLPNIIESASQAGVEKIIIIGTSLKDSKEAIDLAKNKDSLFACVGLHPNDNPILNAEEADWEEFKTLAKSPEVVAIGECGLDYSRLNNLSMEQINTEKLRQQKLFYKQIETARKLNLPLSIHIRDAQDDLLKLYPEKLRLGSGVFHCFSGSPDYLESILSLLPNFYISFAGNLTFKNAGQIRSLAKKVPLEKLLVETDCPFLSPEPLRGSQNVPANVKLTAKTLSEIKGISFEEISAVTTHNANTLFRLS